MAKHGYTLGIELINDPNWMGGTLYLRNLAVSVLRLPARERPEIRLLGAPDSIASVLAAAPAGVVPGVAADSTLTRILRKLGVAPRAHAAIDVVYPGFGAPIPHAKVIRWIPDFQHRYLPQLFSEEESRSRDRSINDIVAKPGVVVLSSQSAADDFARFYPESRATPRVWSFCSLIDTTRPVTLGLHAKYGLPEKYLYLPNQFWVHKNHLAVLKALVQLRDEHGLIIPLICTGAQTDCRDKTHFPRLEKFIAEHRLANQVQFLGLIDRNDQIDVLRCSAAVVQPSIFEGWSTVVEDVRAVGRPIFLSDIPVHLEQQPADCSYFPPQSPGTLAHLLAERWASLVPGPDALAEAAARRVMEKRILDSARVFCSVASEAFGR